MREASASGLSLAPADVGTHIEVYVGGISRRSPWARLGCVTGVDRV